MTPRNETTPDPASNNNGDGDAVVAEGGGDQLSASARRPFSRNKSIKLYRAASSFISHGDDASSHAGGGTSVGAHTHVPEPWGRGIASDLRKTVGRFWWTEMKNLNTKTVGVSFFLFIAVIAPSITFGAVYAKRTNNYMGAVELLLATAWCGIFYSLVAGMPMVRARMTTTNFVALFDDD